jgi:hypothetical protein
MTYAVRTISCGIIGIYIYIYIYIHTHTHTYTKFHEDWCRHSSNIKIMSQKCERL